MINRIKYQYINHFVTFPSFILEFTFSESISSPSCKTQSDFELSLQSIIIHRIVKKNDKMHKIHSIQLIDSLTVNNNSDHPQVLTLII